MQISTLPSQINPCVSLKKVLHVLPALFQVKTTALTAALQGVAAAAAAAIATFSAFVEAAAAAVAAAATAVAVAEEMEYSS